MAKEDLIEISAKYEDIPVPVFELEMSIILKEMEYLENLVDQVELFLFN